LQFNTRATSINCGLYVGFIPFAAIGIAVEVSDTTKLSGEQMPVSTKTFFLPLVSAYTRPINIAATYRISFYLE